MFNKPFRSNILLTIMAESEWEAIERAAVNSDYLEGSGNMGVCDEVTTALEQGAQAARVRAGYGEFRYP